MELPKYLIVLVIATINIKTQNGQCDAIPIFFPLMFLPCAIDRLSSSASDRTDTKKILIELLQGQQDIITQMGNRPELFDVRLLSEGIDKALDKIEGRDDIVL